MVSGGFIRIPANLNIPVLCIYVYLCNFLYDCRNITFINDLQRHKNYVCYLNVIHDMTWWFLLYVQNCSTRSNSQMLIFKTREVFVLVIRNLCKCRIPRQKIRGVKNRTKSYELCTDNIYKPPLWLIHHVSKFSFAVGTFWWWAMRWSSSSKFSEMGLGRWTKR